MTPISGASNATALSILQRMARSRGAGSDAAADTSLTVLGPLESISNASKQAAARIVAILNEQGATIDLSAYGSASTFVVARENATIITGNGNASLETLDHALIWSGDGNDYASAQNYVTIHAGGGNDVLRAYNHATIDAGDGNDWVSVYRNADIDGGSGDDEIRAYDYSTVDAGDGDDFVVTLGNSTIRGGAGNDTLVVTDNRSAEDSTFDNATVDGGDGDDYIQVNGNSTVPGGVGNDTIRVLGYGTTINFQKGDGADTIGIGTTHIRSPANTTINITGYSADDVTLIRGDTGVTVTFKESQDSLTLQFQYGSARLSFEDGSSLDVVPTTFARLQQMDASADALSGQERPILHY
jgi:Ca2+-binding RTX toxin-like protein